MFVDIGIIEKAPPKLLASGCGDLVANVIAVHDWELSRDHTGEYYGRYSASLALLSARIIMEGAKTFAKDGLDARVVVEALISAGVASCIAGSSRPCSGSEHLFAHALDKSHHGVEDAKKVAMRAVKAAIVRNIGTGDGINVATATKDGFNLLTNEQKKSIITL